MPLASIHFPEAQKYRGAYIKTGGCGGEMCIKVRDRASGFLDQIDAFVLSFQIRSVLFGPFFILFRSSYALLVVSKGGGG